MPRTTSEYQRLYESLFEHGADALLLGAPHGRILRANPAACSLFGGAEADLTRAGRAGLTADEVATREFVAERDRHGAARATIRCRRLDGTTFLAEVSSTLLPDFDGGPWTFTSFRDVSAREQARAELENSEARLREILDASTDGYWEVDLRDGRSFQSARSRTLLGLPAEDHGVPLRPPGRHDPPGADPCPPHPGRRGGEPRQRGGDAGRHRGARAGGEPRGLVAPRRAGHPGRRGGPRDQQPARGGARLPGARAPGCPRGPPRPGAPGPLDRAVVAHGLDEILDAVLDARSGGQRIAGVVRDLGTFGRPDPRRQPLRLAEVVEDSVRWLSSSASSSATVQVRIDDAPAVMASAGQLQQVVINLVSNATASIPVGRPGRVDVRVGTSPRGQRLPGGRGQRCGDDARGHAADVRSVLHHQRGGEGAGAGPSHLPRHRHRPRRDHHRLEPPRRGLVVPGRDPGRDRGSTPHRRRP